MFKAYSMSHQMFKKKKNYIEAWITQSHVILVFYHLCNFNYTNRFMIDLWCFYDPVKTLNSATHVTGWMLMAKVSPSQSAVCLGTSACPQAACSMKPTWYDPLTYWQTSICSQTYSHTALCSVVESNVILFSGTKTTSGCTSYKAFFLFKIVIKKLGRIKKFKQTWEIIT